jgi:hypothetical protein
MRLTKTLVVIGLVVIASTFHLPSFAQTPDEFLGYPLGSKYTPHHRVIAYAEAVAKANPSTMKFAEYGKTYENRPLVTVTIGSAENIARLEEIRLNNLRLAGMAKDRMAPNENAPAIVWMSYNVHGAEPASSEAAMKTIHALSKGGEWTKNVVVIIDPCINPDGRDRYVNWYNGARSAVPDADPFAREHQEPWPGARSNHYNFDLNRDWAWMSQVETQQRIKIYNAWLPQVHVDFHEQGINSPYYFAPAAEPYHEVITPWQREFQVLIGRNHAKYFDANGWLYFTKERFDLLYPAYGDTYPTYNGAIGMTYEQGGIGGGLAVVLESGDTLTLKDRLEHHYTTGMSTVEVSSREAARLVKEFRKFFADGMQNGFGEYKSYVIELDLKNASLVDRLKKFLDDNGIAYEWGADNKPYKAYNYITGKEETKTFSPISLVLPSQQPKSAMLKVLFEPRSRITDSATYDVTAWSIPYAWGLKAYASSVRVGSGAKLPINERLPGGNWGADMMGAMGVAIPWNDLSSAKVLAELMKRGVKVRVADEPFEIGKAKFDRGTLIVLKTSNKSFGNELFKQVDEAIAVAGKELVLRYPIGTAFADKGADLGSSKVRFIKKPKVALFTGQSISAYAAGEIWHYFEQDLKYPVSLVNAENAGSLRWSEFDVVIMPEGNYRFLNDKNGQDALKNWVRQGGRLIATENAVPQLANLEIGIKLKKADEGKDTPKDYDLLKRYENRERDYLPNSIPGAVYKVDLDNTHPLAFGMPDHYFTLKMDDNIYEFLKDGWNVGVMKKEAYVSGFAGSKTKTKLKDGTLIGSVPVGRGSVIFFTDDPVFRSFWNAGKLLFANAVFIAE